MRNLVYLFTIITVLITQATFAVERQKVGLVLSGGGAKGSAHISVLKVLEENNVPIDYIVGTSIGAYVAGMYALGFSAAEIEEIMLNENWDEGYSDGIPRETLHYEDKLLHDQYNLPVKLGYSDKQTKTTSGLLIGQSMRRLLKSSTNLVETFESFDDLAIPYRAVAADLVTSKAVVLDSGSIVDAMKASATVPGALQPMKLNGKLLVDGGIANNMPVDVAKAMGADVVIAVDIGSSLSEKENIQSTIDVLNQLSTILTSKTTEQQKALLTDKDILIRPQVGELSTTDWSVLPEALRLGHEAALEHVEEIAALSVSTERFERYVTNKNVKREQWFAPVSQPVVQIVYDNNSKVNQRIIRNSFELKEGTVITDKALDEAIARVYALDKFELVYAEFKDTEEGRILTLTTNGKSWGPNYFHFGFSMQESFSSDSAILIDFAYNLTDLTDNGGTWKNAVTLGYEKVISTEFYQPLDEEHRFYSRNRFWYEHNRWGSNSQNNLNGELSKKSYQAITGLGYNIFNKAILEAGLIGEDGKLRYSEWNGEQANFRSYGGYFRVGFDNLNSINFPTSGNQLNFQINYRNDTYDQTITDHTKDQSTQFTADWRGALSLGNHTFVGIASFAKVENDGDYSVHVSELGGFLNLSAFQKDELVGTHKIFSALVYHYDLGQNVFGLTDLPVYLGASWEAGNVWLLKESMQLDDLIYSGSLFFGTDTSVGPLALGIGLADTGDGSFFLSIGKSW